RLFALPPENPPPPFPRNLPFQFFMGRPMNTLTRSPAGGCVTVAVTRHDPFVGSIAAESIVVFGSATFVRLSHGHTGAASGKSGFGGASAARPRLMANESVVTRITLLIRRCRPIRNNFSFMAELFVNRRAKPWQCSNVGPITLVFARHAPARHLFRERLPCLAIFH